MKSKKSFNFFLVCVSMFVLLLTGCNNMNGPAKENEKGNNNGTEAAGSSGGEQGGSGQSDPTPPVNGIELTWPNVPDGTVSILIETPIENDGYYNLFKINDLSQYTSILDENVDVGKEYTYRICYLNNNGNRINSKEVKIKAKGGKGEKTLNVSRSDEGISLSLEDLSDCGQNYCDIYKKESGNQNDYRIGISKTNGLFPETFTDKFVDSGKSYKYRLYYQVGEYDDALVEWPRYKYVSITADAGSGNIRTTTNLEASYSDSNEAITLTQKPVFNITPDYWSVQLCYSNLNGNSRYLANFSSYDQTDNPTQTLSNYTDATLWTFDSNKYYLQYENVEYQYTEYSNPGVPESIAFRVNVDELFLPITSATGQGIQITWNQNNFPANTAIIEVQDANTNTTLFRVNNLAQVTSVTDKYVTNGNTYAYRLIARDQNYNGIENSGIVRQKASAGLGELTFTAQAAGNGIRLTGQRASPQSEFRIYKRISSSNGNRDTIILNNSSSSFNLTDSFVSAGTDYEYRVQETIGNERSYWQNNVQISPDPLVEYPRFKGQTVTANGGSGNIRITNSPSVSYNDSTESVRFSTKPAISGSPVSGWIYFTYTKDSNGGRTLFGYNLGNNNLTVNLYNNIELAEYTFSNYYINAEFNGFSYEHTEYSLDDFGNFPQTINITGSGRIKFIATNVSEGIKLEWQNLPAETKSIEIRDNNSGYALFKVNDLTQVSSVTDKYVTSGNTYWYYFAAIDENGRWIKQSEIISKEANSGSGELTFSAQATDNGVVLTGQRGALNSRFSIVKKLSAANNNDEGDNISLYETTSYSYSITDSFVNNGTAYEYIVDETIGNAWSYWNNGVQYPADPLVEYPRFNNREITVNGAGGSGDIKITNKFSITYDASNEKFIFSKKPELNVNTNSWSIWFNYSRGSNTGWGTLYSIGSNSNTTVGFNNYQAGQWNFVNYEIQARFDDYSYLRHETSSDVFEAIPETVIISN